MILTQDHSSDPDVSSLVLFSRQWIIRATFGQEPYQTCAELAIHGQIMQILNAICLQLHRQYDGSESDGSTPHNTIQ